MFLKSKNYRKSYLKSILFILPGVVPVSYTHLKNQTEAILYLPGVGSESQQQSINL